MKKSLLASPLYTVETKTKKGNFKTGLLTQLKKSIEQFCEVLFNEIQKASEPQITQYIDKSGHISWKVYEPVTYNTFVFNTEEDVRIWLEDRYYRFGTS